MLLLSGAAGIGSTSPVRQVKWDENSSGHSLAQPEPETLGIPGPKRPSGSLGNCRKAMGWKGAKAAVPAASPVPWELSCRPQATEGGSSGLPQHPEQTPACLMPPSASGFMSPPPPRPHGPCPPLWALCLSLCRTLCQAGCRHRQEVPGEQLSPPPPTRLLRGRGGEEMLF